MKLRRAPIVLQMLAVLFIARPVSATTTRFGFE